MRKIEWTTQFKRDYKRENKGRHGATLDDDLFPIIERIASDLPVEARLRDHALSGNWKNHRDCHVKPDLVMTYRLVDDDILRLVRLGSHSELSL